MERTEAFEAERPRLLGLATRVLDDHAEGEDVVQRAWLRFHRTQARIDDLPAWLTTVTTRLCLDRLRARVPVPRADLEVETTRAAPDPADDVALADTVGRALHAVLDRLTPRQRVAFVLHDSFGFDFATIAALLETTPAAARKLASRARSALAGSRPASTTNSGTPPDWAVVDAFMAAARGGDLDRLLTLLAPEVTVRADAAAARAGAPTRIDGRIDVASFFDGAAHAALPVLLDDRPAAAWYHRGEARVVFEFQVLDGVVARIAFLAEEPVLARVRRRRTGPGAAEDAPTRGRTESPAADR